jgi:hypothetical protein
VTGGVSKSEVSFVSVKGYGVWRVPSRHFGGSGGGGVLPRPILDIYHHLRYSLVMDRDWLGSLTQQGDSNE